MKPAAGKRRIAPAGEHVAAFLVSTLVLGLAAWVLLQVPVLQNAAGQGMRAELRWVWAAPVAGQPLVADEPPVQQASPVADGEVPVLAAGQLPVTRPEITDVVVAPPAARATPAAPIFDAQGRVRLPESATAGTVDGRSQAERVFERVEVDPTVHPDRGLFERDLIAGTKQGRGERWIYGNDVQPARARQAPQVAYNPALHERPEDLPAAGSAQGWLAAPIRDEPVPGSEGQASAALQPRMQAVQAAFARCAPAPAALAALAGHMAALQAAEGRWVRGSSPEERRHTLPAEISRQYNLARRALWWLERRGNDCTA